MIVHGSVAVPGDKSISHRALILAVLGDGPSRIENLLRSADVETTARALRALGADIAPLAPEVMVRGHGLRGLHAPAADLDCGNSGTTTRLLAGVVAAYPFTATFVGDESLTRRPMRRIARPLEQMGAQVELSPAGTLPMTIAGGGLAPLDYASDTASAQVKSAVLLAGLVAGVPVSVTEPLRSRDHTERMLAARGIDLDVGDVRASLRPGAQLGEGTDSVRVSLPPGARLGDASGSVRVSLRPGAQLAATDQRVPGDPSSAAFLAAVAALAAGGELRLPGVCLNPTRIGFFDVLRRMGAELRFEDVDVEGGEPVGTIVAGPGDLTATTIGAAEVPALIDELPLVACLASRARGTTEIRGASELRVKESDRIAAVVANLRAVGVEAEELPDGMLITGSTAPRRGRVVTHGDHRLAMAFGVLGTVPGNRLVIDDPGCVGVSYPSFWRDLAGLAA